MKKIMFLVCSVAMLSTMTSCHRPSSDETVTPHVSPVIVDQSRTLIVTVNTPADISYEGKTVSNVTNATFEQVSAQGKLKITPKSDQYYDQKDMAIDFYDKLTLAVDVQLVKKPTIFVSQADVISGTAVTNDAENQNATGTTATIQVSPTTVITGNTTDPFSITTFVPAETVLESTETGQEVEANVLVIRCTPDGASFSEPVAVTLGINQSSGFDLECVNEDDETETLPMTDLGDDKWLVNIPHFSDWLCILKAIVTEIADGEEVTTGTSEIYENLNTIPFLVKSGAVEISELRCILVSTFIDKEFGKYIETRWNASFTSDANGTAVWRVTHPYKDVTLVSNIKRFKARVYGNPIFEIISTRPGQGGHSGGSGN